MSVAVISANLGGYDAHSPEPHIPQNVLDVAYYHFTSEDLPPRKALSLRLQAKIPKMFGWQLCPNHDAYIWLDAPMSFSRPDSVEWFVEQVGNHADIALFRHPNRRTVIEEAAHLQVMLDKGDPYTVDKYAGEDIDGQLAALGPVDDCLFAAGAFCYRPTAAVQQAMREWWYHVSRFHVDDQLSLPHVLRACRVAVIDENIYKGSRVAFGATS